jgi:photosystem II stability/assembly factor-like uncharacterized protein
MDHGMKNTLVVLLLSLALSACATNNIKSTRLDNNKPLPIGHGVVAVQVINNTDRLGTWHKGWSEVIAVRLDNREELKQAAIEKAKTKAKGKKIDPEKVDWDPEAYSLSQVREGVVDSQLFVGSMPEGEYVISTLYSFYSDGNISSWVSMPVFFVAGTYEVKPGQFTNLGSVVFQPLLSIKQESFWRNSSSQKAYVTRMNELENLNSFIQSHYPAIAQGVDFSKTLQWKSDQHGEYRSKLSNLSRSNAYGSIAVPMSSSGKGAIAAKFGQLRVLDNNNNWLQIDLPTNGQISALLETPEHIIIGGERGQVFRNNDLKGDWMLSTPVSAKEAITWFGKTANNNYALTSSAKSYFLYDISNTLDQWTKIGTFEKKNANDFWVQNGGIYPIVTKRDTIRIINDNKIYDYEHSSKTWTQKKAKALVNMSQLKNGTLLALEVSQWDGVGDQVLSFDDGDSWTTIFRSLSLFGDKKTERILPAMLDDGTLVSVGRGKKNSSGLKIISKEKNSIANKQAWQVHGDAKTDCQVTLPELTNGSTLYFLCDQGEIVSTSDLGETWKTEVPFNIAQMQQDYEAFIEAMKKQQEEE